jgi:hypothetical protein
MSLIWWVLPSIAGVLGLILLFAGFAKLAGLKPFAGVARLAFGSGFLGLAGVIAFAGLNIQTYSRLTYERPVANIKFVAVPDEPNTYLADVTFEDGSKWLEASGTMPKFVGNQWQIDAKVLKFKPMANILGYDSIYRLEAMEAKDTTQYSSEAVKKGDLYRMNIVSKEPGIDVGQLAVKYGSKFGIDAEYGSATYQPLGDGYEFDVTITQDALIARPTPATKEQIQTQSYPGYKPIGGGNNG